MSRAQRSPESGATDGVQPSLPWWLARRARLLALLACLAAAGAGLLHSRTGLFEGGSASGYSGHGCPPATPPLQMVGLGQVVALRRSLLPLIAPLSRSRYAWGTASPDVAWTDNAPTELPWSRSTGDLWPASYEMRVWMANRDDVVADVFLFTSERRAAAYFADATSPRCHLAAREMPASSPPRGRNLIWTNPDGPNQQDLFLLRGPRVYRVADVRALRAHPRPASVERGIGLHLVNTLGCALAEASCSVAGPTA
ncbi:MAG TPA: hypothetical protein VGH78_02965 [Solirubrobacteraceae bacterium]